MNKKLQLFHIRQTIFLILSTLFLALSSSSLVNGQEFDAKHIKAAYIVNFIKNIQWPDEQNKKNHQLAIYKDVEFYQFISQALQNKSIKNISLSISYVDSIAQLKKSDTAFIAKAYNQNIHEIANDIRGSQTLLITDDSDNKHDVMINLLQSEKSGAISFEVNKSNILYEKLVMSADLLLLGGTELDIATLYRETELAMQKTRQQSNALKNNLKEQQKMLSQLSQQLKSSKVELTRLNKELLENAVAADKQKVELAQLKNSVDEKQKSLVEQQRVLTSLLNQSKQTEEKLVAQQELLTQKSLKNEQILVTVQQNEQVLAVQKKELADHRQQLKLQNNELDNKQKTITNQKAYILVTTILTTVTLIASLLLIFLFLKNKKTTKKLSTTLTNLNDTQEQLIQSEKMASLGRLVAGVAHEINTPLSIAITANSLVIDDTTEIIEKIELASLSKARMNKYIEKSMQSLAMSEKALERVKNLLTNFKLVAADQIVVDKREINLAKYIDEVMTTLSIEMKNCDINYIFSGGDDVLITTMPGVFAQVLTNLVMNSVIHAFDEKTHGEIRVNLAVNDQKSAVITYTDNGKGMDEHVLENIFEPFFTTKRGHGSTGLGMNIVYNIINQQLKGSISVESQLGVGTSMVIILPYNLDVIKTDKLD